MKTIPHEKNFCGGNFDDWLEVKLTNSCNGKCSWCVEQGGFRPMKDVAWFTLADSILKTDADHIMLLGGEPTLYPNLELLVGELKVHDRKVYMTTNGSLIHRPDVLEALIRLEAVNISIHHYDLDQNREITGVSLKESSLTHAIKTLTSAGVEVRLNCNLIGGYIDGLLEARRFVEFAKRVGASSVRFAELKFDEEAFVDAREVFSMADLPEDPFTGGCWHEFELDGMPINLRLMCGLQTSMRPAPVNPQQATKQVMYSDGKVREGWLKMNNTEREIRQMVKQGALSPQAADQLIMAMEQDLKDEADKARQQAQAQAQTQAWSSPPSRSSSSGGCVY